MVAVHRTMALSPSSRVSLSPRRRSVIVPFSADEDNGPEVFTPVLMPGHRGYIPVLTMISGWRGKGKSLTMTMLGLIQRERYRNFGMHNWKLMANYQVTGADVVDPDIVERINSFDPRIRDATILIDELPSYFSSRRSLAKSNTTFGAFIQQVRKRNLEVIFTAQMPMLVDVTIRQQIDWYILPEIFGPRRRFLRLYWFDFNGQFMGDGHKYWPPKTWDADIVKIYGPLDSIYGKYRTDQVIAPDWSAYKSEINALTDWDETLLYDSQGAPVNEALPMPQVEAHPVAPEQLPPAKTLEALIDRQEAQVDVRDLWGTAQAFLPKGSSYKALKQAMRARGYGVPDKGWIAVRMKQ